MNTGNFWLFVEFSSHSFTKKDHQTLQMERDLFLAAVLNHVYFSLDQTMGNQLMKQSNVFDIPSIKLCTHASKHTAFVIDEIYVVVEVLWISKWQIYRLINFQTDFFLFSTKFDRVELLSIRNVNWFDLDCPPISKHVHVYLFTFFKKIHSVFCSEQVQAIM